MIKEDIEKEMKTTRADEAEDLAAYKKLYKDSAAYPERASVRFYLFSFRNPSHRLVWRAKLKRFIQKHWRFRHLM